MEPLNKVMLGVKEGKLDVIETDECEEGMFITKNIDELICNSCGKRLVPDGRVEGLFCNNPNCDAYQMLI